METSKVGRRGLVTIPADVRRELHLEEGATVAWERVQGGVIIRPAVILPIEVYGDDRRAEFLLNNAIDSEDYENARAAVSKLGLDPDSIDHDPPKGVRRKRRRG